MNESKMTNGDKIRAMSNEELGCFLRGLIGSTTCRPPDSECLADMGTCKQCWLNWLNAPADGEKEKGEE